MRRLFDSPFQTQAVGPEEFDHEGVVKSFIGRLTGLVNELDLAAETLRTEAPATARHLTLVSRQMAALALAALETWPKVPRL